MSKTVNTAVVCLAMVLPVLSHAESRTRSSVFSEIMSPSFASESDVRAATPLATGKPNSPVNAYNIFQIDYQVVENVRPFYFQRLLVNMNSTPSDRRGMIVFDPRVGARLTNVIKAPRFASTIDFYAQPGVSKASSDIGRLGDIGVQANLKYSADLWNFGSILDFRKSFFNERGLGNDLSGAASPYLSRAFGKGFSTQTWLYFPWRHPLGKEYASENFSWNSPGEPYAQNGIGYSATEKIWVAFLVNNYILTAPTLTNTWASLWVSFAVL